MSRFAKMFRILLDIKNTDKYEYLLNFEINTFKIFLF